MKIAKMKQKLNAQDGALTSTLFQLKENELNEKTNCNCRKKLNGKKFCRINHFKYNWKMSVSSEIFGKHLVEKNKSLDCEHCDQIFLSREEVNHHIEAIHNFQVGRGENGEDM